MPQPNTASAEVVDFNAYREKHDPAYAQELALNATIGHLKNEETRTIPDKLMEQTREIIRIQDAIEHLQALLDKIDANETLSDEEIEEAAHCSVLQFPTDYIPEMPNERTEEVQRMIEQSNNVVDLTELLKQQRAQQEEDRDQQERLRLFLKVQTKIQRNSLKKLLSALNLEQADTVGEINDRGQAIAALEQIQRNIELAKEHAANADVVEVSHQSVS